MKTKWVSLMMQTVMAGAIVLGRSTYVVAGQNSAPRAGPPTTESIERHWQGVIKEHVLPRPRAFPGDGRRVVEP